jgi:hypothetical protein
VNDLKVNALDNQKSQETNPVLALDTETFKMDVASLPIS